MVGRDRSTVVVTAPVAIGAMVGGCRGLPLFPCESGTGP